MIICSHCKGNGYIRLAFEAEESIEQCKVCHSQGELDESSTTIKRGVVGFRMNQITSTGDHLWTQKDLKTTKFIQSKPIVDVKKGEEPSF